MSLDAVVKSLPTPTASDGRGGPGGSRDGGPNLRTAVTMLSAAVDGVQDWAEYEPAIRRQEELSGRPAPVPTEAGPKGGRRLTAAFAEWLMWLPKAHVTGVPGLTRLQQLHKIGNGVVPPQAYEAFRWLMQQNEEERKNHGA
ncbi:DNA (cytosine-5-)-methyltransferase [Kitasatospora sp. Ki12]